MHRHKQHQAVTITCPFISLEAFSLAEQSKQEGGK